jgi:hypothetical protein
MYAHVVPKRGRMTSIVIIIPIMDSVEAVGGSRLSHALIAILKETPVIVVLLPRGKRPSLPSMRILSRGHPTDIGVLRRWNVLKAVIRLCVVYPRNRLLFRGMVRRNAIDLSLKCRIGGVIVNRHVWNVLSVFASRGQRER